VKYIFKTLHCSYTLLSALPVAVAELYSTLLHQPLSLIENELLLVSLLLQITVSVNAA